MPGVVAAVVGGVVSVTEPGLETFMAVPGTVATVSVIGHDGRALVPFDVSIPVLTA